MGTGEAGVRPPGPGQRPTWRDRAPSGHRPWRRPGHRPGVRAAGGTREDSGRRTHGRARGTSGGAARGRPAAPVTARAPWRASQRRTSAWVRPPGRSRTERSGSAVLPPAARPARSDGRQAGDRRRRPASGVTARVPRIERPAHTPPRTGSGHRRARAVTGRRCRATPVPCTPGDRDRPARRATGTGRARRATRTGPPGAAPTGRSGRPDRRPVPVAARLGERPGGRARPARAGTGTRRAARRCSGRPTGSPGRQRRNAAARTSPGTRRVSSLTRGRGSARRSLRIRRRRMDGRGTAHECGARRRGRVPRARSVAARPRPDRRAQELGGVTRRGAEAVAEGNRRRRSGARRQGRQDIEARRAPAGRNATSAPIRAVAPDALRVGRTTSRRPPGSSVPPNSRRRRAVRRRSHSPAITAAARGRRPRSSPRPAAPAAVPACARDLAAAAAAFDAGRLRSTPQTVAAAPVEAAPTAAGVRELYGLTLYRAGSLEGGASELDAYHQLTGRSTSTRSSPTASGPWATTGRRADLGRAAPGLTRRRGLAEGRLVLAGSLADRGRLDDAIALLGPYETDRARPEGMAHAHLVRAGRSVRAGRRRASGPGSCSAASPAATPTSSTPPSAWPAWAERRRRLLEAQRLGHARAGSSW